MYAEVIKWSMSTGNATIRISEHYKTSEFNLKKNGRCHKYIIFYFYFGIYWKHFS